MTIQRVFVPAVQAWDSTYTHVCQDVAFILSSKFFEGAGFSPANPIISARTSAVMQGGDCGAGDGDGADAAQWKMYWPGPDGSR